MNSVADARALPNGSTQTASAAMIEVEDLEISYDDAPAVQGVSFTISRGEHVTLLGPSGCGKTSILRAIAGLEKPRAGVIRIGGEEVYSSSKGRNIIAEKRGVSMVFQSYAIWPHMSVFENVAYGLEVRRVSAREREEKVLQALDLVQMRDFARRPASALSGGQQQRVALARALAFSPRVVLFDEPLSNLDARLRADMRRELRDLQQRLAITSLYVTHDQEEALAISDRVIVMNRGHVEQIDTPEGVYDRPRSAFVADFVGSANLIEGLLRHPVVAAGPVSFVAKGTLIHGWAVDSAAAGESLSALRTAHIVLAESPSSLYQNNLQGRILRRMFLGDFVEYRVEWAGGELIVRRPPTEAFEEGTPITVSFHARHCVLLPSAARAGRPTVTLDADGLRSRSNEVSLHPSALAQRQSS